MLRKAKSDFVLALSPGSHENIGPNDLPPDEPVSENVGQPNLPRLHQFLKIFLKSKISFTPSLLDHSDHQVADDSGKAELLNSFYVRQSSQSASTEEPPSVNTEPVLDSSQALEKFEVSISDVLQVLRTIDSKKAPGFDGIPTRLITMLAKEIAHACTTSSQSEYRMPPN